MARTGNVPWNRCESKALNAVMKSAKAVAITTSSSLSIFDSGEMVWVMVNKPRGYLCDRSDPNGRRMRSLQIDTSSQSTQKLVLYITVPT
eukprot:3025555-Amphidinium_carterae.1